MMSVFHILSSQLPIDLLPACTKQFDTPTPSIFPRVFCSSRLSNSLESGEEEGEVITVLVFPDSYFIKE